MDDYDVYQERTIPSPGGEREDDSSDVTPSDSSSSIITIISQSVDEFIKSRSSSSSLTLIKKIKLSNEDCVGPSPLRQPSDVSVEALSACVSDVQSCSSVWECVPDVVLLEVFRCLGDRDRVNAALVSKQWLATFRNPSLWRTRTINFSCGNPSVEEESIAYARALGGYLRTLSIYCFQPSFLFCKRFQRTLKPLLHILLFKSVVGRARLYQFAMPTLQMERFWFRWHSLRGKLWRSVCRFLRFQKRLRHFDMTEAMETQLYGCKILSSLVRGSAKTLQILRMQDFFHGGPRAAPIYENPTYREAIASFSNLRELHINYSYLSNTVLESITKNCAKKLRTLSIRACQCEQHSHSISPQTWRKASIRCTELKIHLTLDQLSSYCKLQTILVQGMPIKSLTILADVFDDGPWHIPAVLNHIRDNYAHVLESFTMNLEGENTEVIDHSFVQLLRSCRVLQNAWLKAADIDVSTCLIICQQALHNKIAVKTLHVILQGMMRSDMASFVCLSTRFDEELKARGLSYKFTPEIQED